ncbi:MAG: LytTR family DNA-binding domain-containing protein [Eubacteriales bacterium]
MQTLRVAICEDNEQEQQSLLTLLGKGRFPTKVTVFTNGEDFLAGFQPHQYDLILMDIFMGGLTGIQVITQVRTVDSQVPVAFITSSMDFTLESYRLDALKYMEKPITQGGVDDMLLLAHMKQQAVDSLDIRVHGATMTYPLSQILYLEQKGHALLLFLSGGEVVSTNKKLADVEPLLAGKHFLRCHKSYLVNLSHICGLDRELCTFEMVDGSKVYIRNRSFWEMQKAFESYLFAARQGAPQ